MLFSILPIIGFALSIFRLGDKKISHSLFLSISFIIITVYVFGIFNILWFGGYAVFYIGILLLGFELYKHLNSAITFFTSTPFVLFVGLSSIYVMLFSDATFFFWDEYSHWGIYVKEMLSLGEFYNAHSAGAHLRYPPAAAIIEYFMSLNTGYSEGTSYFALFTIINISSLMLFESLMLKHIHKIGLLLIALGIMYADFGHGFSSIYLDHIISAWFIGLSIFILRMDLSNKSLMLLILPLTALTLTKGVGLYFAFAAIGLLLLRLILEKRLDKKKFFITTTLGVLTLASIVSWNIHQDNAGVGKEKQSLVGVVSSILHDEHPLGDQEDEVKKRFSKVFFDQAIHKSEVSQNYNEFSYGIMSKYDDGVKLTTFTFFFFILAVLFLTVIYSKKRLEIIFYGMYLLVITLVYIGILYLSYLVAFGTDALRIPSYVRYVNIGILPLGVIMIYLLSAQDKSEFSIKNFLHNRAFIALGVVLVALILITKPYLKPLYSVNKSGIREQLDKAITPIEKQIKTNDTLFVVFGARDNGMIKNIFKFLLHDHKADVGGIKFLQKNDMNAIIDKYKQFDYIWFPVMSKPVVFKNRPILRMKNKKQVFSLYKVDQSSGTLRFKPVY